ncbi:MAG: sn-glycerol-3-phosphate ABC transporter substrate-binding protein UgpB [Anaerolineae bacterium]
MKKLFVVLSLLVALSMLLSACASQPAPAPAATQALPTQAPAATQATPTATAVPRPTPPPGRVVVEFWYGLGKPLGDVLESIVMEFNNSQDKYYVDPIYKGGYADTMNAAIAAFRAGKAPHIVQMFEVGTATMMAAKGAIKPVHELAQETGWNLDPNIYIPAVRGYYSQGDKMISMPLNSSTPMMYYNKDAFRAAGLDPDNPPKTWAEVRAAAKKLVDSGATKCGLTFEWPTWTQLENFSAIHNVPLATKANGMLGMDAELVFNSPLHVRHLQTLIDMQNEGSFKYGGRDSSATVLFPSGECGIIHASSAARARISRESNFEWGVTFLPYYDDVPGAPINSIIGGASLWVMNSPGRTTEEYKAVAEFFKYISQPEVDARWHQQTGYLPITHGGYEKTKAAGFYEKNPGADLPYKQLTRTQPTENSLGLRLGNMPQIRVIVYEEWEKAFQGQQTAQQAMDNAVKRGNEVLREFEKTYK